MIRKIGRSMLANSVFGVLSIHRFSRSGNGCGIVLLLTGFFEKNEIERIRGIFSKP